MKETVSRPVQQLVHVVFSIAPLDATHLFLYQWCAIIFVSHQARSGYGHWCECQCNHAHIGFQITMLTRELRLKMRLPLKPHLVSHSLRLRYT